MDKENTLKNKSFQFALRILRFYKFLITNKKEFIIAKQVLRSGTSIGAMLEEANQAESKADLFINFPLQIKRLMKHITGLRLLRDSEVDVDEATLLLNDCEELLRLLTAIIKSTKANLTK